MNAIPRWRCLLAIGLTCACAGCGQDGPQRYPVAGTVTFDGKPVAFGNISFDPIERGVGGGFTNISEGAYDTEPHGRGHLGGMHHVQIIGFSGQVDPRNPDSPGIPMFEPYEFDVELPQKAGRMDFEVPLSQAPKARKKPGARL